MYFVKGKHEKKFKTELTLMKQVVGDLIGILQ